MFIKNLEIRNFRNIQNINFDFKDNILYFFAPNGTGKTNLLEALQILSLGKSLRTKNQSNILPINYSNNIKLIVKGNIEVEEEILILQEIQIEKMSKTQKTLYLNNHKIRLYNYIGNLPSIWFGLENIKALTSSPSNKRKFIDQILIQLNPKYHDAYNNYERSLKQRNKLLKNETINYELIHIWEENLIKYGSIILNTRNNFFNLINKKLEEEKNYRYEFKIKYKHNPNIDLSNENQVFFNYQKIIEKNRQKDFIAQSTTIGPHRDNWEIYMKILSNNKINNQWFFLDDFGSRGQQRMALITLIKVFINIFHEIKGKKPILLLDDVFSELDNQNIDILANIIKNTSCQTFITGVNNLNIDIKGIKINLQELLN